MKRFSTSLPLASSLQGISRNKVTVFMVDLLTPSLLSKPTHRAELLKKTQQQLQAQDPQTTYKTFSLPKGTILEGRDVYYPVEESKPLWKPGTSLSSLPKKHQEDVHSSRLSFFDHECYQYHELLEDTEVIANQEESLFYVHPSSYHFITPPSKSL